MSYKTETQSVVIVGVGGQGILLASTILAQTAMEAGFDVKTNEIHGMAQRGGSVIAQVRFGKEVFSPLVPMHGASILASFERIETFRYRDYLAPGGWAIASDQVIIPVTASSGQTPYPELNGAEDFRPFFPNFIYVDAVDKAKELGNPRLVNSIIMGVVSQKLDFVITDWEAAFHRCVKPKLVDLNMKAFLIGRNYS